MENNNQPQPNKNKPQGNNNNKQSSQKKNNQPNQGAKQQNKQKGNQQNVKGNNQNPNSKNAQNNQKTELQPKQTVNNAQADPKSDDPSKITNDVKTSNNNADNDMKRKLESVGISFTSAPKAPEPSELPYKDEDVLVVYAYRDDSASDIGRFDCYCKEEIDELLEMKEKEEDTDENEDYEWPECILTETLSKEELRELKWEEEREASKKKAKTEPQGEEEEDEEEGSEEDEEYDDEFSEEDDSEEEKKLPIGFEQWGMMELHKDNPNNAPDYVRVRCQEYDPFRGSVFSNEYQWKWACKMKKLPNNKQDDLRSLIDDFF